MCIKIKLDKISDIQKFITKASKYDNLTINSGKYVVNASSLMGILSLDLEKTINLCWRNERISEKIRSEFKQWAV